MLVGLALVCLLFGAALSFISSLPFYAQSFSETHSIVGIGVIAGSYLLWIADANPTNLYFGVVVGGWAALIDKEHIVLGLIGLGLTCIARFISFKLNGR